MGILSAIVGNRIYLDTNVFIYALEGYSLYAGELAVLFAGIDEGTIQAVTSQLTLAETLVKPLMMGDLGRQALYEQAIRSRAALHVADIDRDILVEAARLRATTGLKLPDAVHAATARRANCTVIVTNDARFRVVSGIDVVLLSEVIDQQG